MNQLLRIIIVLIVAGLILGVNVLIGDPGVLTVCAKGCNFSTIQAAIDAAKPGDVIEVKVGSYRENVIIRKALVLKGEDADKVTLASKAEGKPVILIEGDQSVKVVVSGFTVTGAKGSCVAAIKVCPFGVSVFGKVVVTLQQNRLLTNKYGIVAGGESQLTLTKNMFTDNETAIMLRDQGRTTIQDSSFERNQFGILIGHQAQAVIRGNNISGSDGPILVWDQSRIVIENNVVSRNKTGLSVKDQSQAAIISNAITGNNTEGIWISGQASVSIQRNLISGHRIMGIGIAQQATVEILHNKIIENRGWGALIWIKECEEQAADVSFWGKVTGKSNQIPGPGEPRPTKKVMFVRLLCNSLQRPKEGSTLKAAKSVSELTVMLSLKNKAKEVLLCTRKSYA